jgi:hypothetical protein
MLNATEQRWLVPVINQVLTTADQYNKLINGFMVYVTGSSLNFVERVYNDIDLMVVIPNEGINNIRSGILADLRKNFQDKNLNGLQEQAEDPKFKIFGFTNLFESVMDSLKYSIEINNNDTEALLHRLGSTTELNRIILDPKSELLAINMRLDGELEAEKHKLTVEPDGTAGYQFGPLVEAFLKDLKSGLDHKVDPQGKPLFYFQLNKSFPEGYGKVAGENNCYISPAVPCAPLHVFLTTGVELKKAMEKKDSFMLEYYSEQERMQPIRLY